MPWLWEGRLTRPPHGDKPESPQPQLQGMMQGPHLGCLGHQEAPGYPAGSEFKWHQGKNKSDKACVHRGTILACQAHLSVLRYRCSKRQKVCGGKGPKSPVGILEGTD